MMASDVVRHFYECGICGALHSVQWNGDCREDAARFNVEDLDEKYGRDGWAEIEMDEEEIQATAKRERQELADGTR